MFHDCNSVMLFLPFNTTTGFIRVVSKLKMCFYRTNNLWSLPGNKYDSSLAMLVA